MKIAIIGSRYFTNEKIFNAALDDFISKHSELGAFELLTAADSGLAVLAYDYANNHPIGLSQYTIGGRYETGAFERRDTQILLDSDYILVFISNKNDPLKIMNKVKLTGKPTLTFYE